MVWVNYYIKFLNLNDQGFGGWIPFLNHHLDGDLGGFGRYNLPHLCYFTWIPG